MLYRIILAITTLYVSVKSLQAESESLMQAVHILSIISASIQILAIVAGWTSALIAGTAVGACKKWNLRSGFIMLISLFLAWFGTTLTYVATFGGPLGLLIAVAGFIVFLVWLKTRPGKIVGYTDTEIL
jgi:hypothetical protein